MKIHLPTIAGIILGTAIELAMLNRAHANVSLSFQVVSECEEADYVDGEADVNITTGPGGFTPRCLRVHAGTVVTRKASIPGWHLAGEAWPAILAVMKHAGTGGCQVFSG